MTVVPAAAWQSVEETSTSTVEPDSIARWRAAFRGLALGMGALHTVVAIRQQAMSEDGINYLDSGSALFDGDWAAAINGVWSPMYSALLGAVQWLADPPAAREFPVAQITNFAIFAAALWAFEFFWKGLAGEPAGTPRHGVKVSLGELAPRLWLALGYSLFIWVALCLITIWSVTPDMLLASFVFVAGGLFLRIGRRAHGRRTAVLLGAVLGAGYLAKAPLFPLGLLLIGFATAIWRNSLHPVHRLGWLLIPFVLVTAPLVATLSVRSGHLTFGDVGRFTYMKHVNGLQYPHWGGSISTVDGAPTHPPALVVEQPDTYTFAAPIKGTYPLAFDPAYWTAGLVPRVTVQDQLRALGANAVFYWNLFARAQGGFVAVVLMLALVATWSRSLVPGFLAYAALACWAVCAFGLYAFVHTESRYVGVFLLVLWGSVLGGLRFGREAPYRRVSVAGAAVLSGCVWINIAAFNIEGASGIWGFFSADTASERSARFSDGGDVSHPHIADALQRRGLRRGDRVAVVGDSFGAYWARLGRFRIVAEVPPNETATFWAVSPLRRDQVLEAFASAGAVAVIAARPAANGLPQWEAIGETGYIVRVLSSRGEPAK
jgi:hypothetical protein